MGRLAWHHDDESGRRVHDDCGHPIFADDGVDFCQGCGASGPSPKPAPAKAPAKATGKSKRGGRG